MNKSVASTLLSKLKVAIGFLVVVCLSACLNVSAQHTKLLEFNGTNGAEPWGSLISDGTFLYGMTGEGGVNNNGVIFKIMPNGSGYLKLFDFEAATSGNFTPGSLVYDGTFLYGMANDGGANDFGTIFKIRTDGTDFEKLLDFAGSTNGARPEGSLFSDGTFLYGMTTQGGANNLGTIFKILPDGTAYTKLLDFTGTANGATPYGSLTSDGTFLYGMTSEGGSTNNGTIFKILKDGTGYVRILNFNGAGNGKEPFGTLLYDGTFLYGMTIEGGSINDGVIFKIRPDGTGYVKLFEFDINNQHASTPFGDLVTDGVYLYGMTYFGGVGGTHDYGRLFKILQDGTDFTPLFDFTTNTDGWLPYGSPLLIGSTLYGLTQQGGTAGVGTIFSYELPATTNEPPVIASSTTGAWIEGIVRINLLGLVSDPDDNLDPSTLSLLTSTSEQGASASINSGSELVLDYDGVLFVGTDRINIEVCDLSGDCAQQELVIEIGGDIMVYNAISPNQDDLNDKFLLEYIDVVPDAQKNKVTIFNRWGDLVFEITNYDNDERVFTGLNQNGKELPSGTYYYKIEFSGNRKTQTGYLSLKR
jgi:gliding motility-associated-like protein